MPRNMPRYDSDFERLANEACALAKAGEAVATTGGVPPVVGREFTRGRLEALYEMAMIRIFVNWEVFLEQTLLRYMCGYQGQFGQETPTAGSYYANIGLAETALYAGQNYLLWHNPARVITRCQAHITNGRHELVVSSSIAKLEAFASIRHRIAHGQDDAKMKFNLATVHLNGKRYPGARAGTFLRDTQIIGGNQKRWLESIADELKGLTTQIM